MSFLSMLRGEPSSPLYKDPMPIFYTFTSSGSAIVSAWPLDQENHERFLSQISAATTASDAVVYTNSSGLPTIEWVLTDGTPLKPNAKYSAIKYEGSGDIYVLGEEVTE